MSVPSPSFQPWQFAVDTGGTFTDCLATSPYGDLRRIKVLSTGVLRGTLMQHLGGGTYRIAVSWPVHVDVFAGYVCTLPELPHEHRQVIGLDPLAQVLMLDQPLPRFQKGDTFELSGGEEAPVLAARMITGTPLGVPLPAMTMRLGSTKGTNALLEHKGAPLLLLVTQGYADVLRIGLQQRPDLFALHIQKPAPLYTKVLEVPERLHPDGTVEQSLSEEAVQDLVQQVKATMLDNVAICLLHSYRNPVHEAQLARALKRAGIRYLSYSHQLSRAIQYVSRTQTTVVNGYLSPVLHAYLRDIRRAMGQERLLVMTSAGGLISAKHFHPKDSLFSGPAGGLTGAAEIARRKGRQRVLTFDMGGTSTDVARYDQGFDYQYVTTIGTAQIQSPSLAIETVAAGGGSVCGYDGFRLTVGPESAGARPGPACYGAGGPLTITDVNLLLGKLDPQAFGIPIRPMAARQALQVLRLQMERPPTERELLLGLEHLANQKMAEAIRKISVERGFHPSEYHLIAFGGAGGQHACALARLLNIQEVVVPYDAGLLSAFGIRETALERFAERQVLQPWEEYAPQMPSLMQALQKEAREALMQEGVAEEDIEFPQASLFLRLKGQESTLEVPYAEANDPIRAFKAQYEALYGHWVDNRPLELASVRLRAREKRLPSASSGGQFRAYRPKPHHEMPPQLPGGPVHPVHIWDELRPGALLQGPAVLVSPTQTVFVEMGWQLLLDEHLDAQITRNEPTTEEVEDLVHQPEAVALALYTSRFTAIAQEMGSLLQRTSFSVNVKERLDFSCAVLDAQGRLLVNAPHIPVHLGSLGVCLRLVRDAIPLRPGDVVMTNHPAFGGSHLPDITLLAGAFTEDGELIGYVANRAHHAEIGGKTPGSMPADARNILEEGVVFRPCYLVEAGEVQWASVEEQLQTAPYPTRALAENLADLNGALAAIRYGVKALENMAAEIGLEATHRAMGSIYTYAKQRLHRALVDLQGGPWQAEEYLDDGSLLKVNLRQSGDQLIIDFTGTADQHPGNLNANRAIVNSVVLYVLRLLVDEPLPLNEGLLELVEVILPKGSLLNPAFCADDAKNPAVVGGNTEVSQRLTDLLLKALGRSAGSQGTMNNTLFGDDTFGYYETVGGGTGAGPGWPGADAVHQHMTNTRITDPEVLEWRYPVRLREWSVREGSGGAGSFAGGKGMVRELEFTAPVTLTVLTQHRNAGPFGLAGGESGAPGQQQIIHPNGKVESLLATDRRDLQAGDRYRLETPGGGGYGQKNE